MGNATRAALEAITLHQALMERDNDVRVKERERIAVAVEAQIRHLRAVPPEVTEVPRDAMVFDLQSLADDIRRGRYTP